MKLNARDLRNALGTFATGVTIVTTRHASGADVGLTANSFSSVSLDPPMVLWSLAKSSSSIEAFRAASHFAVHILAADQDSLSSQFASKAGDKFAGLEVGRGRDNIPLLLACTARFECRTAFQYEGGDHLIFVGEIHEFTHSDQPPLIFHGGRYGMLLRKEQSAAAPIPGTESRLSPDDLLFLVSRPYYQLRYSLIEERRLRGLNESEYAVMGILGREGPKTTEEIAAAARFYNWTVTPDAITSLARRELVTTERVENEDRLQLTPAGRIAMVSFIAIAKSAEADALDVFDASEVYMLKKLLRRLAERSVLKLEAALANTAAL